MHLTHAVAAAIAGLITAASPLVAQPRAGYAMVNGLRMYYEVHGAESVAPPLVLLHGGGSTIRTNFERVIPGLAATRQVIAVEFQAHGHTKDIDRAFTFEQSADDVAALLDSLRVPRADILGFSNGGTTALQLAIRHPSVVRRLIIASANYRRDGMPDAFWEFMQKGTFADLPQAYRDAFQAIDSSAGGVRAMYRRDADRMLAFRDIPDAAIEAVQAPSLVVVGDRDVVRPEHALALSRLLPHARLCILPGGHGEYLGEISFPSVGAAVPAIFVALIDEFLRTKD